MQYLATEMFSLQALFTTPPHRTSLLKNPFGECSSPIHPSLNHNLAFFLLPQLSTPRKRCYFQPLCKETYLLENKTDIWLQGEKERCREHEHRARKVTRDRALKDETGGHKQPNRLFSQFCSISSEEES